MKIFFWNMDRDEDYRIMKGKAKTLDTPSEMECRALLIIFNAEGRKY